MIRLSWSYLGVVSLLQLVYLSLLCFGSFFFFFFATTTTNGFPIVEHQQHQQQRPTSIVAPVGRRHSSTSGQPQSCDAATAVLHHHHTYKSSFLFSSIDGTGSGDYDEYDPTDDDDDDDDDMISSSFFQSSQTTTTTSVLVSRRRSTLMMALTALSSVLLTTPTTTEPANAAAKNNGLPLTTAPVSGLRWADAKIGTPQYDASGAGSSNTEIIPRLGAPVAIDYSMASTIGRFPSIYTTKDKGAPYSWILGDGTTIKGIELAILGSKDDQIPPMKRGGIRRVIIPNTLGYNQLIAREKTTGSSSSDPSPAGKNKRCVAGNDGSIGPIPPKDAPDGAYQRWYQLYCNPRIPYQPEIVLDIKLYRLQ